jgi:hypothetical protein
VKWAKEKTEIERKVKVPDVMGEKVQVLNSGIIWIGPEENYTAGWSVYCNQIMLMI